MATCLCCYLLMLLAVPQATPTFGFHHHHHSILPSRRRTVDSRAIISGVSKAHHLGRRTPTNAPPWKQTASRRGEAIAVTASVTAGGAGVPSERKAAKDFAVRISFSSTSSKKAAASVFVSALAVAAASFPRPALAAAAAAGVTGGVGPAAAHLRWTNLASAGLILTMAAGSLAAGVGAPSSSGGWSLAASLLRAAARCAIQLNLVGGLLLTNYLLMAGTRPGLVLVWLLVSGALAANEASARSADNRGEYPHMRRHVLLALLAGCGAVMSAAAPLRAFGRLQPWYSPRTWIPVSGMLVGNALTATGLAASTWTRDVVAPTRRGPIEAKLARGASWREALRNSTQTTFKTALTPTINALSVTGVVHLPGMMTGQILAGQSPYQAATYQVIINFLIAASSALSVQTVIGLATRASVDKQNHRLFSSKHRSLKKQGNSQNEVNREISKSQFSLNSTRERDITSTAYPPTLTIYDMAVERTGMEISLALDPGDRIGIQGPSGVGKSQILRTAAGLEPTSEGSVLRLNGNSLRSKSSRKTAGISPPEWRRRVALVPQDRPALEGTPNQFYAEVRNYRIQREQRRRTDDGIFNGGRVNGYSGSTKKENDPVIIAASWGLPASAFDQAWSTLSGGEAQRASLAIVLALEPDVLLLDECTSALDEATAVKVEDTIRDLGIPVLMVSHSNAQLRRFCTATLDLSKPMDGVLSTSS